MAVGEGEEKSFFQNTIRRERRRCSTVVWERNIAVNCLVFKFLVERHLMLNVDVSEVQLEEEREGNAPRALEHKGRVYMPPQGVEIC